MGGKTLQPSTAYGTLTLEVLAPGSSEKVITYLARFYSNDASTQLAARLERLPLVLSQKIPTDTATPIVAELTRLGARARFVLNSPMPETAAKQIDEPLRDTLLKRAFRGGSLTSPVSPLYRIGLAFVTFAMVTLPLIYLAIVGGVATLVGWHAVANTNLFHTMKSAKGALFLYVMPLVVGVLLVFFMIKPLFARAGDAKRPIQILPKAEPLLAAFIERICRIVGAPLPTVIYFDNQVNASASFRNGLLSFRGNDLALTLGLPLAKGLDLNQFAGVLAHEFGHFAQTSGMRLTYLIRSINAWFARVVYEEDAWDVRLRRWSTSIDFRIGIILLIARFFIWLTRRVLWLLMHLGHLISCFMLRQMEFDADRFEAGMVGGDVFASTCLRLLELDCAHDLALDELTTAWREEKFPNDLATYVLNREKRLEESQRRELASSQARRRTALFDTHPADPERIAAARSVGSSPLFAWPGTPPTASILFNDFEALSRRVTLDYYKQILGKTPERHQLIDVESLVRKQGAEEEANNACTRFFCGHYTPWRPILSEESFPSPAAAPKEALNRLKDVRAEIEKALPPHSEAFRNFFALREQMQKTGQARALLESGFRIQPASFQLHEGKLDAVAVNEYRHGERNKFIAKKLDPLESLQRERLCLALQIAQVPAFVQKFPAAQQLVASSSVYWKTLNSLEGQLPLLERLNLAFARLDILGLQLDSHSDDEKLIEAIRSQLSELCDILTELRYAFGEMPYPFEHTQKSMSVGLFLIEALPTTEDIGGCYTASGEALDRALDLILRLAARLSQCAETVEKMLGLSQIHTE